LALVPYLPIVATQTAALSGVLPQVNSIVLYRLAGWIFDANCATPTGNFGNVQNLPAVVRAMLSPIVIPNRSDVLDSGRAIAARMCQNLRDFREHDEV
jgi:hypothetical protein